MGDALSGKTFESINLGTGKVNSVVVEAGVEDVDFAVKTARKVFETGPWTEMDPSGRLLYRTALNMREKSDFLAEIVLMDNGLLINETKFTGMPATIDVLEVLAG